MNIFQTRGVGFTVTSTAEKLSIYQTRLCKIRFHVRDASCVAMSRDTQCSLIYDWYDRTFQLIYSGLASSGLSVKFIYYRIQFFYKLPI